MGIDSKTTESIREYFKTQPVLKAYLFGSYARGEAAAGSDIDLLVELDHSNPVGLRFIQMKLDLEKMLQSKVDLVSSDSVSKYIKPIIDKEKQLLYARQTRR